VYNDFLRSDGKNNNKAGSQKYYDSENKENRILEDVSGQMYNDFKIVLGK